jgi:hypothetical protein
MTADDLLAAIAQAVEEGFGVLVGEITPEIEAIFRDAGLTTAQRLKVESMLGPGGVVDQAAADYARQRAGELIKNFAATTPEMLRATVAQAIEEGWSAGKLRDTLHENYAFSPARALTIARTESAVARRKGGAAGAKAAGAGSKHWYVTHGDVDAACLNNQAAGWVALDDDFPEGDDPHPNCLCYTDYRSAGPGGD